MFDRKDEPLIEELPEDFFTSNRPLSIVYPRDEAMVEVVYTIAGPPMLLFEYPDGTRYSVTITRLCSEVDKIHLAKNPAKNSKPMVKPRKKAEPKTTVKPSRKVKTRHIKVAKRKPIRKR